MKNLTNFFKKSAVAIGISIVFPLLISAAFDLLCPRPQYPDFASVKEEERPQVRNKWNNEYQTYLFYYLCVAAVAGCLAIVAGSLIKIDFLASGFIVGGVLSLLSGFLFYWHYLQRFFQLGALVIALLLLIICGYFFIERQKTF